MIVKLSSQRTYVSKRSMELKKMYVGIEWKRSFHENVKYGRKGCAIMNTVFLL